MASALAKGAVTARAYSAQLLTSGLWFLFFFELVALFSQKLYLDPIQFITIFRLLLIATLLGSNRERLHLRNALLTTLGFTSFVRLILTVSTARALDTTFAIDALLQPILTILTLSANWGVVSMFFAQNTVLSWNTIFPLLGANTTAYVAATTGAMILTLWLRRTWRQYVEKLERQLHAARTLTQQLQTHRDDLADEQDRFSLHNLRTPLMALSHLVHERRAYFPPGVWLTVALSIKVCQETIDRPANITWFSLEKVLNEATSLTASAYPEHPLLTRPAVAWRLWGSARLAREVLLVLLENAYQHGEPPLHISLEETSHHLLLVLVHHCERQTSLPSARRRQTRSPHGNGVAFAQTVIRQHFGGQLIYRKLAPKVLMTQLVFPLERARRSSLPG